MHRVPKISIIIVHTNDHKVIFGCLESIRHNEPDLSKEIIIVDNNSENDISNDLPQFYPEINYHRLSENLGFCKANNVGIRKSSGEFILLLNPDTLIMPRSISMCIQHFENYPGQNIGLIGCKLLNRDLSLQRSFFWNAASIQATIQANPLYINFFGNRIKNSGTRRDDDWHSKISEVKWLCGAFLLMPRKIIEKENCLLDEDFFLYSDDVEFGNRVRKKGYRVIYFPLSSIVHYGGGGTIATLRKFNQIIISEWLCMMKIHGKACFLLNQNLLLINMILDEFYFYIGHLFKKPLMIHLRTKIERKKIWNLWWKYSLIIFFRFRRAPSASGKMLKYQ